MRISNTQNKQYTKNSQPEQQYSFCTTNSQPTKSRGITALRDTNPSAQEAGQPIDLSIVEREGILGTCKEQQRL